MPWITTKTGKHINTDWFLQEEQINKNKAVADKLNQTGTVSVKSTKTVKSSGKLLDPSTGFNKNAKTFNSKINPTQRKQLQKSSKTDEKVKRTAAQLGKYGHPNMPVGGKRIRHEDWKPLKFNEDDWGGVHKITKGNNKAVEAEVHDRWRFVEEKDIHPVKKADLLKEIDDWKNDDGTYGDSTGDQVFYVCYENGDVISLHELNPGEKWSRKGICGIEVSTADYQMVWGEELVRPRSGPAHFEPLRTTEFDDSGDDIEGFTNSYSGYKSVGGYREREVEQNRMVVQINKTGKVKGYWEPNDIRYKTKREREVVQRSTVDWNEAKKKEVGAKHAQQEYLTHTVQRLQNKGLSTKQDVEAYVNGLSDLRSYDLANKLGITADKQERRQQLIDKLYGSLDKETVEKTSSIQANMAQAEKAKLAETSFTQQHDRFKDIDEKVYNKLPKYIQKSVIAVDKYNPRDYGYNEPMNYSIYYIDKGGQIQHYMDDGQDFFSNMSFQGKEAFGDIEDFDYPFDYRYSAGDFLKPKDKNSIYIGDGAYGFRVLKSGLKYEDYPKTGTDTLIVKRNGKFILEPYRGQNLDDYEHYMSYNHEQLVTDKWNSNSPATSDMFKDISLNDVYSYLRRYFNFKG